jgi:hypothetical protein
LANSELLVTGATSHLGVASYLVTLPDGTTMALPIWMTEAPTVGDATVREVAVPSRRALEALRALVDDIREAWARSASAASVPSASGDQS